MNNKITYTCKENLIDRQNKAERLFLAEFEKKVYSPDEPLVIKNPYLINPLSALVMFVTNESVAPTLIIQGKRNSREDISHSFPPATEHILPVLGLYADYDNQVVIVLPNGKQYHITIRTEKLPDGVGKCLNISTSLDYMQDNMMFLTPSGRSLPAAYDYKGEIRWLLTEYTMFDIKRAANGNLLTGSHRFCRMPYNSTGLIELNMLGKIYKEYRLPGNYHHDQFEMEDGNLLVLTQDFHRDTVEDICALIDRNTGDILKEWDCKTFLPQNVAGSGSQDEHDWFHNNSVWYDKKTNSLTLSGRHQDAIVNIDYDSGTLNWIIGDPEGWPRDLVDRYFFKPVGDLDNFDWQYEQHAALICPNSDVMVFDNGQYRSKIKENYIKNRNNFSRGVRYRIDTDKMEIEQVWQFGKELGQAFYSPYISNVEYYDEGHYMIHSGGIGFKDGFASDSLGAFLDKNDPSVERRSITVEQKDGLVLYQMEVDDNYYRAEKLTLYHEGNNLEFIPGKLLGRLDVTPEFDTVPDFKEVVEAPDAWHNITIEEDVDRIVFHGKFERGTLVMLCLEGEKENHHYFVNTSAVSYLAMCSGVFLEDDDRDIKMNISKEGFKGSLEIKVIINDKKYRTGICIYCS